MVNLYDVAFKGLPNKLIFLNYLRKFPLKINTNLHIITFYEMNKNQLLLVTEEDLSLTNSKGKII